MGFVRRFLDRLSESDEERMAKEIRDWASAVPDVVSIADAPKRAHTKVAGVVKRITVNPMEGSESLEAQLSDGTGAVQIVWMGRRDIEGLTLGTRVIVEGVIGEQRGVRRMVNPRFEFSA